MTIELDLYTVLFGAGALGFILGVGITLAFVNLSRGD